MVTVNIFSPVETQITQNGRLYEIDPYTGNDCIRFETQYPFSFEVSGKGFNRTFEITDANVADYLPACPERENPEIYIYMEKEIPASKIKACYDRNKALEFLRNMGSDTKGGGYACVQLEQLGMPSDIALISECLDSENPYIKTRAALAIAAIGEKYSADFSMLKDKIAEDYKKISHIRVFGDIIENTAIKIGVNNMVLTVFSPVETDVYADGNFIFNVNPYTGFDYNSKSIHYPVNIKVTAKGFSKTFSIDENNFEEFEEPAADEDTKEKRMNIFMKNYISREETVACYDKNRAVEFLEELAENPHKMGGGYACEQLEELGTTDDLSVLSVCIKKGSSFVKAKAAIAIDKICKRNNINTAKYAKQIREDYQNVDKKGTPYNYVFKNTLSNMVKNIALLTVFSPVNAVVYSGKTNEKLFEINLYSGIDYGFCYIDYNDDIIIVAKNFEKVFTINEETIEQYKDSIPDESECARISIFLKNYVEEKEIESCFEREKAVEFLESIKDNPKSMGASYACRQLEVLGKEEDIPLLRIFEENAAFYIKLRAKNAIEKIKQRCQ